MITHANWRSNLFSFTVVCAFSASLWTIMKIRLEHWIEVCRKKLERTARFGFLAGRKWGKRVLREAAWFICRRSLGGSKKKSSPAASLQFPFSASCLFVPLPFSTFIFSKAVVITPTNLATWMIRRCYIPHLPRPSILSA